MCSGIRRPRRWPLLLGLLVAPLPAWADEPGHTDLDDLSLASLLDTPAQVWTATRTEQKSSEAPAIITTITREQIEVWGYRSLTEILGHVLGFYVVDDHTSANVAVRGISGGLYADSSIVKLLIDGHSVSFQSTGGNALGPELIPLSAVDRIEIVRGPGSALFGADAFLGVVNVITRTGKSLSGGTAWLGAGRAGQHLATDVDASAGFSRGDFDVLVALRRESQDLSGLLLPATSPSATVPLYNFGSNTAHGMDETASSALARVTWRPRPLTELAAFGYYSASRRGDEFGSLVQLASGTNAQGIVSQNRVSQDQMRAGLTWNQGLGARLQLSVRGSLFEGGPNDDNRLEVGSDFYYVRKRFGFRGGEVEAQLEYRPGWAPLTLVAGASTLADDELLPSRIGIAKQATGEGQPGSVIEAISLRQGRKTFINNGAYLQGIWTALGEYLGVTGGLRYDRHNVYGGQVSGRVGLVSSPLERLHGKLLYGTAFKAPSPFLLYALPSAAGDVIGNAQLKPQYVQTGEFQLSAEPWDWMAVSSDVALSVLTDKAEFVQQGINKVARNVAHASTVSWESLIELKYRQVARAHASFELQRTERRTGQEGFTAVAVGTEGDIYPRAMLHTGLVAQPTGFPVRAAVQASYIGIRRSSDTNTLLNSGPYRLEPYVLVEAGLSTIPFTLFGHEGRDVSFSLTGKNLLGATGPAPGFSGVDYPLAPRTFFLQMSLTL
jgi:outer membrane receptor for ferrienterochelin and colicins